MLVRLGRGGSQFPDPMLRLASPLSLEWMRSALRPPLLRPRPSDQPSCQPGGATAGARVLGPLRVLARASATALDCQQSSVAPAPQEALGRASPGPPRETQ